MSEFEFGQDKKVGTNQHAKPSQCRTCGGDRFVTVALRSPETTVWMSDHGIHAATDSFHEEVAPCPDCHPTVIEYWHHDGKRFRSMDAAAAREALRA